VAGGVGSAGGGGDLRERFVEGPRCHLRREPPSPLATRCVAPPDLPATTMKPDAHAYPWSVVRGWVRMWVFVT
jgi:hypothetical protein